MGGTVAIKRVCHVRTLKSGTFYAIDFEQNLSRWTRNLSGYVRALVGTTKANRTEKRHFYRPEVPAFRLTISSLIDRNTVVPFLWCT